MFTSIFLSSVVTCCAGNLNAVAQRGNLDVDPSRLRSDSASSLTTTPSVSNPSVRRRSRHSSQNVEHLLHALAALPVRFDGQAPRAQGLEHFGVGVPGHRADHLIDPGRESALGHLARVDVPHGARRGVARVGEDGLARRLLLFVRPLELRQRQKHLAADFDAPGGPVAKDQRNASNRPHVVRHVFTVHAVTSRGAADETAVLVGERNAEAIDLELGHVGRRAPCSPRPLRSTIVERAQILFVVGVVEAQHRRQVFDVGEAFDQTSADTLGRGIVE